MNYAELIGSSSMAERLKQLEPKLESKTDDIFADMPDQTPRQATRYSIYDLLDDEAYPDMSFGEKAINWAKKEAKFIPEVSKSLARGAVGVSEALGKTIYMLSDALKPTAETLTDLGNIGQSKRNELGLNILDGVRQIGLDAQEYYENVRANIPQSQIVFKDDFMKNPSFTRAFSLAAESIPLTASALVAGAATKSPAIAYAIMGAATAGDVYQEGQEAGLSREKAFAIGVTAGTGEALIERYLGVFNKLFAKTGVTQLTKPMATKLAKDSAKMVGKSPLKRLATKFSMDAVQEGSQEGLQQVYTNWVRKLGIDETINISEGLIESVIAGGISGGLIGGVTKDAQGLDEKIEALINEGTVTQDEVNIFLEGTGEVLAANSSAVEPVIQQAYEDNITNVQQEEAKPEPPTREDTATEVEATKVETLEEQARKYDTVEEFIKSKEYQGGIDLLAKSKEIEVYDQYENQYTSVEEINDKISELKRELYNEYDSDIYDSQEEFEEDIESEISELEKIKENISDSQRMKALESIDLWLQKNKNWLGENYDYVSALIYNNKETNGTAWEELIENDNTEEVVSLIERMEIAQQRHETTEYDTISKKGLSQDQVSEIRTEINKGLNINFAEFYDKGQLTEIYNKANQQTGDKTTRLAEREAQRLYEKYGIEVNEGDLQKYQTVTNKDQLDKALVEFDRDLAEANQVALGLAQPKEGILPTAYYVIAEKMAIKNRDVDMLQRLATQSVLAEEASKAGQFIQMLSQTDADSPVKAVADVAKIKTEAYNRNHKVKAKDVIKKEKKLVKKTIDEAYNELDAEIDNFIKDLEC